MSAEKFFLLRLDRFIPIFVYFCATQPEIRVLTLRLTISADLLPLSVRKNSDLFALRVLVSEFRDLSLDLCHGKQRVAPFCQAFSFRVIDSSSVRTKERLTDKSVMKWSLGSQPCGGVPFVRVTQLSKKVKGSRKCKKMFPHIHFFTC